MDKNDISKYAKQIIKNRNLVLDNITGNLQVDQGLVSHDLEGQIRAVVFVELRKYIPLDKRDKVFFDEVAFMVNEMLRS